VASAGRSEPGDLCRHQTPSMMLHLLQWHCLADADEGQPLSTAVAGAVQDGCFSKGLLLGHEADSRWGPWPAGQQPDLALLS